MAGLTIALLLPALLSGVALATAADHLPMRLSDHADVRSVLRALASGVLLAGVFAMVLLLATRRWLASAALLAVAVPTLAMGLTVYGPPAALAAAVPSVAGPADPAADPAGAAASVRAWPAPTWSDGTALFDCATTCTANDALLPNLVLSLSAVYVLGLSVAAYALFDPRSYR